MVNDLSILLTVEVGWVVELDEVEGVLITLCEIYSILPQANIILEKLKAISILLRKLDDVLLSELAVIGRWDNNFTHEGIKLPTVQSLDEVLGLL